MLGLVLLIGALPCVAPAASECRTIAMPRGDCVHLTLSQPARVVRMFPVRQERTPSEVFVSSDRPREFCALLGG